jgi:protein-disulfide isomerase
LKVREAHASLGVDRSERRTTRVFHCRLPYRILLSFGILVALAACGGESTQGEVEALRKEVAELKQTQGKLLGTIAALQAAAKNTPTAAGEDGDAPKREAVHRIPTNFSPRKGNQIALVTVVEFADFQCPFCQSVAGLPDQLVREFPDDVQFVFKHYPLMRHTQALDAAKAGWAAHQQGKFWEMHNQIYGGDIQQLGPDRLRGYAEKIGLDMAKYDADVASPKAAQSIAIDKQLGKRMKVGGTPTYFVNGKRVTDRAPGAVRTKVIAEMRAARAARAVAPTAAPPENAAPADASANGS